MSRHHEFDFEPRDPAEEAQPGPGRAGGGSESTPDQRSLYREGPDRQPLYGLRDLEVRVMRAVGAFRTIDADHLPKAAVDSLVQQGLASRDSIYLRLNEPKRTIVALTRKGGKVASSSRAAGSRQRYYSRVVKPREIRHDLAMYPAFLREAKSISARGGHIQRVVLDYEFKSAMAKRMNAPGPESKESRRRAVAQELELPIVDEHLKLPDVRIEYEDELGHEKHLDLEIVTEQYRGRMMSAKAKTGFKLSGVRDKNTRAKVRDDHHHNLV